MEMGGNFHLWRVVVSATTPGPAGVLSPWAGGIPKIWSWSYFGTSAVRWALVNSALAGSVNASGS